MRIIWVSLFVLFLSSCAGVQSLDNNSDKPKYATDALTRTGLISPDELIKRYVKFSYEYDRYTANPIEATNFARLKDVEIYVFFGLWCHDSQREIPRLLKLIEASGFSKDKLNLVAIDTAKSVPTPFADRFSVRYTPTIYVTQNQQIIAKVVEKPANSLAKDILSQIFH